MSTDISLVSIIIPTFNRAHFIRETLDSILAQTYQNWECIVVDDGSIDNTDEVLAAYIATDSRFCYYRRPNESTKGATVCRNIGLTKATGAYIIFFDSDDLMTPDHIAVKLVPLLESEYDFSITKTKYFNDEESLEYIYNFKGFEITAHNYIMQHINWLTLDVCIKTAIAKSIHFNENLKSGQEYNYFSKLVLKTQKYIFIDKCVSLRRKHEDSIQGKIFVSDNKWLGSYVSIWETYKEIKPSLSKKLKKELLFKLVSYFYKQKHFFVKDKIFFIRELYANYQFTALYFIPMIFLRTYANGGYYFRQKLKKRAYRL